jgi:hypothetical protein
MEVVPLFLPGAFRQTSPEQRLGHHGDTKFPRLFPNHHTIMILRSGRVEEVVNARGSQRGHKKTDSIVPMGGWGHSKDRLGEGVEDRED